MERPLINFLSLNWANRPRLEEENNVIVPAYLDLLYERANINTPIIILAGYEYTISEILASIISTNSDYDPQNLGFRENVDYVTGLAESPHRLDMLRDQFMMLYFDREVYLYAIPELRKMIDQILTSLSPTRDPEQYRIRSFLYVIKYAIGSDSNLDYLYSMLQLLIHNQYNFDDRIVQMIHTVPEEEICDFSSGITYRVSQNLVSCLSYIARGIANKENQNRLIAFIAAIEYVLAKCSIE